MKVCAVIAASGQSKRMGGVNKMLLPLLGKPVLAHALEAFEKSVAVDGIVVVTQEECIPEIKEVVERHGFKKVRSIVAGGRERQDSVYNGLLEVKRLGGCEVVAVHNGANPLVSGKEIEETIDAAREYGAAAVANPVRDTIKVVDGDGVVLATPDRSKLWAMQTPQVIKFDLALKAFGKAREEGFYGTDDVQLVERIGGRVKIVQGSYKNFKITTPEDVLLAEEILESRTKEMKTK